MQLVLYTHGSSLKRRAERFVARIPNREGLVEIAASKVQSIVGASLILAGLDPYNRRDFQHIPDICLDDWLVP